LNKDDVGLIARYYELGLAVSDDEAAVALYNALPGKIKARVHHPAAAPFNRLRAEATPARRMSRMRPVPPEAEVAASERADDQVQQDGEDYRG
jgi:hypothetical protein